MRRTGKGKTSALAVVLVGGTILGCQDPAADAQEAPSAAAAAPAAVRTEAHEPMAGMHRGTEETVEAGRYLIEVAGCNDCHTEGYLPTNGNVPESEWLKGSVVGFSGPWGTTYPSNLRLTVTRMSEEEWVEMLGSRTSMPPMPWMSVAAMTEADRRAIYRYIRSLGEPGDPTPTNLPPGREPTTPWIDFVPRNLPQTPASTD